MVSVSYYWGFSLLASSVIASSAEFILNSNNNNLSYPLSNYDALQYNEDGVVGQFRGCDTCANFTGLITDEGYYEITETSAGDIKDALYLNIDDTTGLVTVNTTASTSPFTISTHLFYYNSSLQFSLVENKYNETYYLYYVTGYNLTDLGKNYTSTLNTAFANGTRYLYYAPDEASSTQSFSTISHIPNPTSSSTVGAATTESASSSAEASSSSSKASAPSLAKMNASIQGLLTALFGFSLFFAS